METTQQTATVAQAEEQFDANAPKKPYATPKLIVHGTVSEITNTTGAGAPDGIVGSTIASDRGLKQDFAPVDPRDVLRRLASMPVETWSYKFQDRSIRHIGPMAQDFAAAFGVGEDDKQINMVDANGVATAAIQALYGLIQERDRELMSLRTEIAEIRERLTN